jgi:hypothetical protein
VGTRNGSIKGLLKAWKGLHGILKDVALKIGIHNALLINIIRVVWLFQGRSIGRNGGIVEHKNTNESPNHGSSVQVVVVVSKQSRGDFGTNTSGCGRKNSRKERGALEGTLPRDGQHR